MNATQTLGIPVPVPSRKILLVGACLALGMVSLGGCATKGFVRQEVGVVDTKLGETQTQVATAQENLTAQDARLGELDKTTRDALERATAAGKLAEGKFLYSTVLADDSVKFPVDKAALSKDEEVALAAFVEKLKADNKNVYVEIQGHTDATGPNAYNIELGQARAEAVRRYLNKQGMALNRIGTVSYGEEQPVAPNTNRQGRAQNRRVVLVVLA